MKDSRNEREAPWMHRGYLTKRSNVACPGMPVQVAMEYQSKLWKNAQSESDHVSSDIDEVRD